MVEYITTAHGIAQRLSEKWRHFVVHCLYSLFCTSPRCVGVWAVTTPPRPMHKPQLRPHIARRSRCGDGSLSAMCSLGARRCSFFCAALKNARL